MDNREWTVLILIMLVGVGIMIVHGYQQTATVLGTLRGVASSGQQTNIQQPGATSVPVYYAPFAADASANPRNSVILSTPGGSPMLNGINTAPVSWSM